MPTITDPDGLRAQARRALADAEGSAGVKVKTLEDLGEIHELTVLFAAVWGAKGMISTELLRALGHSGNYVAGAFSNGDLVGGAVGFVGIEDGRLILHSHIVGVAPGAQGRNIGFTLKQHQRRWTLDRDITTMHWTFDPLVRRNAYFNINKLAADMAAYHPTFYGVMTDGLNAGDESDRMVVSWELSSQRVVEASRRHVEPAGAGSLISGGAAVFLADRDGEPVLTGERGSIMLCATPADIVKLRESDLDVALAWRKALRAALGPALDGGYRVTGFTRDGHYVLEKKT